MTCVQQLRSRGGMDLTRPGSASSLDRTRLRSIGGRSLDSKLSLSALPPSRTPPSLAARERASSLAARTGTTRPLSSSSSQGAITRHRRNTHQSLAISLRRPTSQSSLTTPDDSPATMSSPIVRYSKETPSPIASRPSSPLPSLYKDLCEGGEFFSSDAGCNIARTEDRGIMLRQLWALVHHVERRCANEQWRENGTRLEPHSVNLYQVVANVVKPATKRRRCSFVELVAKGPQPPLWFVSHWWGEPVFNFVSSLQQHSKDRDLREDSAYWVCAYANNQWDLGSECFSDPSQSSFRRAMQKCVGMVSVVDSRAVCYSRIWCCYEVFIILSSECKKYDMYTMGQNEVAVGITDGHAAVDERGGPELKDECKYEREKMFPFALSSHALSLRLQDAESSKKEDRRHILNSIVGARDSEADPPREHDRYEQLNGILRGRYAAAAWRYAMEAGEQMDSFVAALAAAAIRRLALDFGCSQAFDDDAAAQLATAFPRQLSTLRLGLSGCRLLSDAGVHAVVAGLPRTMAVLDCNLTLCESLTDASLRALRDALPWHGLRRLALRFTSCSKLTDDGVYAFACKCRSSCLEELTVDFSYCSLMTSRAPRQLATNAPETLRLLNMYFVGCSDITMVETGKAVKESLGSERVAVKFFADNAIDCC